MTAPTLDEMLDTAGAHARNVLVEKQLQTMLPIFHLSDAEGTGYIVGADFTGDTPEEVIDCKDVIAEMVRALCVKHKIVQYLFMSEAWMIVRQNNWKEGISTPPSEAADRIEVVIATAQDGNGGYRARRWLLKRNKRGKAIDLVLDPAIEGETPKPSGRFDGLLG